MSTYLHSSSGHHVYRHHDYPLRVVVSDRLKRWEVFTVDGRTFHDSGSLAFGSRSMVPAPGGAKKALREWVACEREAGRVPFR